MASSYAASRDYSKGVSYERGSRLATSFYQGPARFDYATETPGAVMVKLAHQILVRQGQRRALALAEADYQSQQRTRQLQQEKLEREADPNYMSPYQKGRLGQFDTAEKRAADAFTETKRHNQAMEGLGADRIRESAARRLAASARRATQGAARKRYTAADSGIKDLLRQREASIDAAEAQAAAQVNALVGRYQAGGRTGGIAKVLRLDRGQLGEKPGQWLIDEAKRRAGVMFDQQHAGLRQRLEKVKLDEAGVALAPDYQDDEEPDSDWGRAVLDAVGGGGGAPAP